MLDTERNLILYISPKQRTDVGSIPARIPSGVFFNTCLKNPVTANVIVMSQLRVAACHSSDKT